MDYAIVKDTVSVQKTIKALSENGFKAEFVSDKAAALQWIQTHIPKGSSVMNGSSRTLEEVGFVEYLKAGAHGWDNVHTRILSETDPEKQALLRKQSVLSDYYLGSVHAVTEDGQLLIASNTGSQLPHLVFTSPNLILVVGTQKIVPTLADGIKRLEEYVVPLEDQRMMGVHNVHTQLSKLVILKKEPAFLGRTITVLFVGETLGY